MMRSLFLICLVLAGVATSVSVPQKTADATGVANGVAVSLYNNTCLAGSPLHTSFAASVSDITFSCEFPCSLEAVSTLSLQAATAYSYDCSFVHSLGDGGDAQMFLWVDDHLVCQSIYATNQSKADGSLDTPIRTMSKQSVVVRLRIYSSANGPQQLAFSARWFPQADVPIREPNASQVNFVPIPSSVLVPSISEEEQMRSDLQRDLAQGWGYWLHQSILSLVLLPDAAALDIILCRISTQQCLEQASIDDSDAYSVRPGLYALDRSFAQYYVAWNNNLNVSVSLGARGARDMSVLISPVSCDRSNCSDFALVLRGRFAWSRAGAVFAQSSQLDFEPAGLARSSMFLSTTGSGGSPSLPPSVTDLPHMVTLLDDAVAVNTGEQDSVTATQARLDSAQTNELVRIAHTYSSLSEAKVAMQAAVMWTLIYTPSELGMILPVSRSWSFTPEAIGVDPRFATDWTYVIFDWDNIFAVMVLCFFSFLSVFFCMCMAT